MPASIPRQRRAAADGRFGDIFSDIFGEIFGGGRGGRSSVFRGADLRYNLEITLEQAAHGFDTKIRIPGMTPCETCKGSGAKAGTQPSTCPSCRGAGQVRVSQGPFSIAQTCPRCHGSGSVIPNPCSACNGAGRVKLQKTMSVKIPAGVDEGDRVRLSGEGEPGVNGGPPGDLYVQVHIKPHPVFQRDHDDLHCEMPVAITAPGARRRDRDPTLDGSARIPSAESRAQDLPPEAKASRRSQPVGRSLRNVAVETRSRARASAPNDARVEGIRSRQRASHPRAKGWSTR